LISIAQVPAFPGAAGGGAQSVGGRGGIVYEVTNLDDSGPGSLRTGIEMTGPRTIVFRVGGTINIRSGYTIINPFLTIAGQTAPGGGIQICGKNTRESIFIINTHDVIIRYLRIRHGYNAEADQTGDPVSVMKGHDVIIDHCTLMWTSDENSDAWGDDISNPPHNITWSWNIFAEPLKAHPTNFITGSNISASADLMTDIDAHHNLLANSSHRNPLVKNKTFRFVNNIVYNWRFYATQAATGVSIDVIGNLYKPGPLNSEKSPRKWEIEIFPNSKYKRQMPSGESSVYVTGNMGPNNPDLTKDNWVMVTEIADENGNIVGPLDTRYRRQEPLPALPVPIRVDPANDLEKILLPTAGASQRLDELGNWVSNRDAADLRIINEYNSLGGILPAKEDEVGGFPVIAGGTPFKDRDHDGMPDKWEKLRGLNPKNVSDGPKISSNGYSNLENYLNGVQIK
jgi:pectate lyase